MKLDYLLIPYTKISSKWIKDLNVRLGTIKILEENIGTKILDISCSNIFYGISPRARKTKGKKNKQMRPNQTKKFLHSKGNHQQNEKTAQ